MRYRGSMFMKTPNVSVYGDLIWPAWCKYRNMSHLRCFAMLSFNKLWIFLVWFLELHFVFYMLLTFINLTHDCLHCEIFINFHISSSHNFRPLTTVISAPTAMFQKSTKPKIPQQTMQQQNLSLWVILLCFSFFHFFIFLNAHLKQSEPYRPTYDSLCTHTSKVCLMSNMSITVCDHGAFTMR